MNKTVKGVLAAATACVLLLGGAGTLAYWTESQTVSGAQITSGSIALTTPDCSDDAVAGTHGWQLDGATAFVPGTTDLVPGDTVTKVCAMTLTVAGPHVGATLTMDDALITPDALDTSSLAAQLDADATFTVGGASYAPITDPGDYDVLATVTVTFAGPAATSASENGDVDLDAINLVAEQTHP